MARFQFQVSDSDGKVRKGTMEARSLTEAREIALKRGYTIIELREVLEAPETQIKVQTRPATSRYHTGPATAREFTPSLGQRLQALFPTQVVRGVMGTLMVVGLIWMVVGWKDPGRGGPGKSGSSLATPALNAFKLLVEGSVEVQGSSSLGDVQISIDLPDIPYQQTYEWPKIKHPREGHFSIDVEFESARKARQLIVRARKPGLGEASTEAIPLKPGGGKATGLVLKVKPKKR